MTTEWKPEAGKPAMVMVTRIDGELAEVEFPGGRWRVGTKILHPLPTPDPLAEKRDAVVAKWLAWRETTAPPNRLTFDCVGDPAFLDAVTATDALRAAMAPKDPVKELREAAQAVMQALGSYKDAEYRIVNAEPIDAWAAGLAGCAACKTYDEARERLERAIAAIESESERAKP